MFADFTPGPALAGGVLIGISASLMLLGSGRVAGICGIFAGMLAPRPGDLGWRAAFVLGLAVTGALLAWLYPASFAYTLPRSSVSLVVAGLLVGYGTRLGNGCTSGHGVCGLSRQSPRSLAATVTFMGMGMVVAALVTQVAGGRL